MTRRLQQMFKMTLVGLVLLLSMLASGAFAGAGPQQRAVCQGSCGGGCGPCPGAGGGNQRSGPSAQDLREEEADQIDDKGRAAMARGDYEQALEYFREAYDKSELERHAKYYRGDIAWARGAIANRNGVAAADRGDFTAALSYFQQAAGFVPDAKGYQEQVAWAKGAILDQQAHAANAKGDYRAALKLYLEALETLPHPPPEYRKFVEQYQKDAAHQDKITRTLSHLADSVEARPAPAVAGLEFSAAAAPLGTEQPAASKLDFNDALSEPGGKVGGGLFGTTSNPAHPDLGGVAPSGFEVHSNREVLSSGAKSGSDAEQATGSEQAKGLAGCGFDGVPCRAPDPIPIERVVGQSPGAMDIRSHIPDGIRQDAEISSALAWYDKLAKSLADSAREMAELQEQIASGTGNTVIEKARQAELEYQSKQQQSDQGKLEKRIKNRLLDLQMVWIETPQQSKNSPKGSPQEPVK